MPAAPWLALWTSAEARHTVLQLPPPAWPPSASQLPTRLRGSNQLIMKHANFSCRSLRSLKLEVSRQRLTGVGVWPVSSSLSSGIVSSSLPLHLCVSFMTTWPADLTLAPKLETTGTHKCFITPCTCQGPIAVESHYSVSRLVVLFLWSNPAWYHLNPRWETASVLDVRINPVTSQVIWKRWDGAPEVSDNISHEHVTVEVKNGTGIDCNKHSF